MRKPNKQKNPIASFFQKKEMKEGGLLCVYGFSEEAYFAAKKWVAEKRERLCVFIEEDPQVRQDFLKIANGSLLFEDPQVEIHFLESTLQLEPLLKKICWNSLFSQKELISFLPEKKKKRFEEISSLLEVISMGVELTLAEFSDFGVRFFSNVFHNLLHLKEVKDFSHLRGAFSKIPAIVCGASPSLKENLPLLKKLKNHALIFGGGSALNVLSANAVPFHFAASVDKESPHERFLMQASFETPFFFQNQISSLNLSLVHAPLIRVGGYSQLPFEKWIDENLTIASGFFDGGWTVATFLLSLADFLGCDPIIMVGMDFSFEKKPYAGGVLVERGVKREFLSTKDRRGKKVWTQKDWLLARNWIEEFARKRESLLIDASRGLSFQGVENRSLLSLSKQWTDSSDLSGKIHALLTNIPSTLLSKKRVVLLVKRFQKSLSNVADVLDKEIARGKERNTISFEEIEETLLKEKSYELLVAPLWRIWLPLFEKNASVQELTLHRILFLKRVVADYQKMVERLGRTL